MSIGLVTLSQNVWFGKSHLNHKPEVQERILYGFCILHWITTLPRLALGIDISI
jgi:hypothetical protein